MRFSVKLLSAAVLFAAVGASASASAPAAELTGTLKKIKESGVIVLGNRDSSIPFSYLDNNQKPIGYSWDIAMAISEHVKKELGLAKLEVENNLVTSQTRVPLVQNGTVDLECGSTTNNVERKQQVDFSVGIFQIGTRLLTRKSSGIKDFPDLNGKNVVVSAGTTTERLLKVMNVNKQMGMNIISAKDHGESFLILQSGRAVAFMMDDAILAGEMGKAQNPNDWVITGKPQSYEIYGCMLRKGDTAFKKVVDDAIKDLYKSGSINKIYAKWFLNPIPPKGMNLHFPMPKELKALIAKPTDKSAEQLPL
jgi:glutamate/aspartate transport system substrate-binding protein